MDNLPNLELQLELTIRPGVTVLPRCLQILSRRGFILTKLTSRRQPGGLIILECIVEGPKRWHTPIITLLERLTDVEKAISKNG